MDSFDKWQKEPRNTDINSLKAETNNQPTELKPCPICKNEAQHIHHFDGGHCHVVECMKFDCWVSTKIYEDKQSAINGWNTRHEQ